MIRWPPRRPAAPNRVPRSGNPGHWGVRAELMEKLAYRQIEFADRGPLPVGRA
jgi:hypothetical protein